MAKWGIDLSKWNGDFNIAAAGPDFVVIKAGGSDDGLYMDSQFHANYNKCKKAGIPCGLYWFTAAASVPDLQKEIDYLLNNIKGMQFELPIYLDVEVSSIYSYSESLVLYWLTTLYRKNYYPGVYSGYYWMSDMFTDPLIATFPIWLAYWTDSKPSFKWNYGMWQQGQKYINDVEVDIDYLYADYTSVIKEQGLNGYTKPVQKSYSDVTKNMPSYKAIMWCTEQGIVQGYKDGTFRPKEPCTREQVCMMLWRQAGKPEI